MLHNYENPHALKCKLALSMPSSRSGIGAVLVVVVYTLYSVYIAKAGYALVDTYS